MHFQEPTAGDGRGFFVSKSQRRSGLKLIPHHEPEHHQFLVHANGQIH
jgi:hypothetical protein